MTPFTATDGGFVHSVYPDIEIGDRVTRLATGARGTVTAVHPGAHAGHVDVAWDEEGNDQ